MKKIVIFVLAMLMLSACGYDPRRDAEAYATYQQSDVEAEQKRQALQHDDDLHAIRVQQINAAYEWIRSFLMTALIAAMFAVFVSISSAGIGSSFYFIGTGIALTKRNLSMPNLIKLDPVTRQFPILISKIGEGKYSLSNPNTNSVTFLYDRNPADKMMIQAMAATQHDGALAYQARLSHKPGEIVQVQSPDIQIVEIDQ